ncbi:SGNH/GDSL hydrolase family protein [Anaerobacillus sp. CMMVII]|uniref:SGNH/GDSL hydrolase family protein n=1 Tax=Anaerobacillus sp. CMMVII TaxID=2755588 RepID=UPI0021B6F3A1|nr:hypothetical protein [Anaerobacillus sp. CMMVII]MCT8137687.1 SGNH/GDSL hydrolase family protein [Anaerobacillus sp. CMMVII]
MKKIILMVLLMVLLGTGLLFGKIEYDNKLKLTAENAHAELELYNAKLAEEKRQAEENERQRIEKLVSNLQAPLKEKILNALAEQKPLKVVAMGSRALTGVEGSVPWPELLQDLVNDTYGQKLFEVTTLAYGTKNTFDIVRNNHHLEVAELQPDIFILEPFIWNDNGYARIEDTLYHIDVIVRAAARDNEDLSIFIQPSNPIYGSTFFQQQVERVKEHSLTNRLAFIDHWEAWPDPTEEQLKDLLVEEDTVPNQEGHSLWAKYLLKTFANE